jgi:hypothetical protein
MGFLALLGCIFIVFCFRRFKDIRSFAFRLVYITSLCDIGFALGNILGDAGGNPSYLGASKGLCFTQSVLISYFGLASVCWSTAIAFTLHMAFLVNHPSFQPDKIDALTKYYNAVCFGFPLIVTILPMTTSSYGDTGGWCWITDNDAISTVWRFLQFYLPLWVAVSYSFFVYTRVRKQFAFLVATNNDAGRLMMNRIRYYPLVLVVCYFFGSINVIFELSGTNYFWLNLLHAFLAPSQGLVNAFVYGYTPIVHARLCQEPVVIKLRSMFAMCGCVSSHGDKEPVATEEPSKVDVHVSEESKRVLQKNQLSFDSRFDVYDGHLVAIEVTDI